MTKYVWFIYLVRPQRSVCPFSPHPARRTQNFKHVTYYIGICAEYAKNSGLRGCDIVSLGSWFPTFRMNVVPCLKNHEFREQFSEHVAICHNIPEESGNFRIYVCKKTNKC
jgi:hypothetical protein